MKYIYVKSQDRWCVCNFPLLLVLVSFVRLPLANITQFLLVVTTNINIIFLVSTPDFVNLKNSRLLFIG